MRRLPTKHLYVDGLWDGFRARHKPCASLRHIEVRTARLRERREAFRIEDANADSAPVAAFEDCSREARCPYCGGA